MCCAHQGGTEALKLDLRDHRQHKLTVLVQRRLHGTLLDRLVEEAEQRWGRCASCCTKDCLAQQHCLGLRESGMLLAQGSVGWAC